MQQLSNKSIVLILTLALFIVGCSTAPKVEEGIAQVAVSSSLQRRYDEAIQLMDAQQYSAAASAFSAIIEENNQLSGPYLNLGLAYWQQALQASTDQELTRQAHIDQAEQALQKAADLDQALSATALMQLGILYRYTGRFEAAKTAYDRAIQLQPDLVNAYKNRAVLCDVFLQDFACAAENYQSYRQRSGSTDEQLNLWIADARRRAGLPSEEEIRAQQVEAASIIEEASDVE